VGADGGSKPSDFASGGMHPVLDSRPASPPQVPHRAGFEHLNASKGVPRSGHRRSHSPSSGARVAASNHERAGSPSRFPSDFAGKRRLAPADQYHGQRTIHPSTKFKGSGRLEKVPHTLGELQSPVQLSSHLNPAKSISRKRWSGAVDRHPDVPPQLASPPMRSIAREEASVMRFQSASGVSATPKVSVSRKLAFSRHSAACQTPVAAAAAHSFEENDGLPSGLRHKQRHGTSRLVQDPQHWRIRSLFG